VFSFGEERGTRFFTDDGGAFVQDVNYQPFGKPTSTGAQPGSPLYSNEQWNYGDYLAAFGISKLGARLYDPAIGRFLSRDPLLIPRTAATTNPYAFAANDPVNHSDPTGLLLRPDELPGGKEGGGGGGQSIDWTFVDAEINLLIVLSGGDLIGTDPTIPWLIEIPNIGSSGSGSSSQSPQAAVAAGGLVLTLPKPIPFIGVGAAVGALLAAEGGVLLLGAVPGVGLLILGLVVPAPPGYVPLRCGDYNDHCWKDYMRRVKAENDRQTEILNELEEAAERDKLAKQGKAEADGMTGYPDGMPGGEPDGPRGGKTTSKGTDASPAEKRAVRQENRDAHDGKLTCEHCGRNDLVDPQRARGGVPRPANEAQVDHIVPKAKGGEGKRPNLRVLCPRCNTPGVIPRE
jgi:RHS repeat-associated protein